MAGRRAAHTQGSQTNHYGSDKRTGRMCRLSSVRPPPCLASPEEPALSVEPLRPVGVEVNALSWLGLGLWVQACSSQSISENN